MLRWHAVCLLRFDPHPRRHGDIVASRSYRLHDAIHDQLPGASKLYDRDPEEGQRGAQVSGEVAGERREQRTHPRRISADDYRWAGWTTITSSVPPDQRIRSAAYWLRRFLKLMLWITAIHNDGGACGLRGCYLF